MKKLLFPAVLLAMLISCEDKPKETTAPQPDGAKPAFQAAMQGVTYQDDTVTCQSMIVLNSNDTSKRPGILVIPEWWGLNGYIKRRAEDLAKMGYVAMAVDMYGRGKTAESPVEAGQMSMPFYENPQLAKKRFEAALHELKSHPQVDSNRIAAIGYCFGGSVVLTAAKLGSDFNAGVSFHGGLAGVVPEKDLLKTKILVCHGAADSFVPQNEVDAFKKQMDAIGADYQFLVYPNATHAFTNPDATATGKKFNLPIAYNEAADTKSWQDMTTFFEKNLR